MTLKGKLAYDSLFIGPEGCVYIGDIDNEPRPLGMPLAEVRETYPDLNQYSLVHFSGYAHLEDRDFGQGAI